MKLKDAKPLFILVAFIFMFFFIIYTINNYWPKYENYFFEFGILGRNTMTDMYFPNNNSTIYIGTPMKWYIYINNHMGGTQKINIKIKLLNSSMLAPDDIVHIPSPENSFIEFQLELSENDKIFVPFSWSIFDVSLSEGTTINSILVNDVIYDVFLNNKELKYRIVFELWVYDFSNDRYIYGWNSKEEFLSASSYIWFNLSKYN